MPSTPPDFSAFPDGTPLAEIAAAMGVTIRDVRRGILGRRARASSPRRRRRPDPALEEEIVRRYLSGEPLREVAAAVHRSPPTVLAVLERHGVERRSRAYRRVKPAGPPRRIDGAAVVELYRNGMTQRQVAAKLGCGATVVGKRLHEAGIRTLYADQARDAEIARRWADGQTLRQIGAAVGMSRSGVRNAVRRLGAERAWAARSDSP
jgi:DNA-binding CsgD family transcriptional regulator